MAEAAALRIADDPLSPHRELLAALAPYGLDVTIEYPGYLAIRLGSYVWVGDLQHDPETPPAWVFDRQATDLSATDERCRFAIDVARGPAHVARGIAQRLITTLGDALDAAAALHAGNRTAEDAIARLNLARVGCFVTPTAAPLTADNLPYLYALRNHLFTFTDAVEREIARIEKGAGR